MQIAFEPLRPAHLPLLTAWLQQPHVRAHWDDGERDEASVRAHYFEANRLEGNREVPGYVFTLDGQPAGFIQHERVTPEHEFFPWAATQGESWGLDLFIGEAALLGRGVGPQVIRAFITSTRAAHPVRRFLIDPDSRNLRARRAYEKVGFQVAATAGELVIMTLDVL